METFVGDTVRIILKCGIDISGYTTLEIKFKRPDGTRGVWTSSLHATNDTWMEYVTSEADLDMLGIWAIQSHVEGGGSVLHGKWVDFIVYNPIFETTIIPTTLAPTTAAP
jgi:hypothetical protein